MGRKAIGKHRKKNEVKKRQWAKDLFPYFQEHGLEGITIDKMANWLGKSKSTLYEYFQSKEEIVNLALFQKLQQLHHYEAILSNQSVSHIHRYENFMQFISDNISDISNQFLQDLKAAYPLQQKMIDAFLQTMLASLNDYYLSGIKADEFQNISIVLLLEADRHFLFEVLTNPDFLMKHQLTIKDISEQYMQLKFEGLSKK